MTSPMDLLLSSGKERKEISSMDCKKLDHEFLAVFKLHDADPKFVTFRDFVRSTDNEFDDVYRAWSHWYFDMNRDPDEPDRVMTSYPENCTAVPGTLLAETDPDFIPLDEYRSLRDHLGTEEEICEGWFRINLFPGTNQSEITFLVKDR